MCQFPVQVVSPRSQVPFYTEQETLVNNYFLLLQDVTYFHQYRIFLNCITILVVLIVELEAEITLFQFLISNSHFQKFSSVRIRSFL